jgi:hypothetical protein
MRIGSPALLSALFVLTLASARAQTDVFLEDAGTQATADQRLVVDARLGREGAEERLRARLALAGPKDAISASGWSFLCNISYHRGHYRRAEDDCASAVAADPNDDNRASLDKVRLLRELPQPSLRGLGATAPIDEFGQIKVHAARYAGPAMIDTGAQISVMMQSVAEDAHVRLLGATANAGTTTTAVDASLGVVPRVRIGSAELLDIPVLVLPDSKLTFAGGAVKLPFILGLHALELFGRVAWLDHYKLLALGDRAAAPQSGAPLAWYGEGVGVALDGAGGQRMAQLDTGSDATYLFDPGLALLSEVERHALTKATRVIGGVGGVATENVRRLPSASLLIDGQPLALTDVVVSQNSANGEAARIGRDTLERYSRATLDFNRMVLELGS